MRLHIQLEDMLVAELDRRAGKRGRSAYIGRCIRQALDNERRWELILESAETIPDDGHEWDDDPAGWVASQRRSDPRRVG